MGPDSDGNCYSYYGKWNINDRKPKYGVHLFMLDEYIKNTVDKEKENFNNDLSKIMRNFNSSLLSTMSKNKEEIEMIKGLIADLNKFVNRTIYLNGLKAPEIEKIITKKKKRPVTNEEDSYDGYL